MSTISRDRFTKQSHELRIATDQNNRVRLVAGAFYQRQTNHTRDEYRVANLASSKSSHAGNTEYYRQICRSSSVERHSGREPRQEHQDNTL